MIFQGQTAHGLPYEVERLLSTTIEQKHLLDFGYQKRIRILTEKERLAAVAYQRAKNKIENKIKKGET